MIIYLNIIYFVLNANAENAKQQIKNKNCMTSMKGETIFKKYTLQK